MKYQMRELRGDDLFILLNIISRLELQDDLVSLFETTQDIITSDDIAALKEKHKDDEIALKAELNKLMEKALEKRGMKVMANLLVKVFANLKIVKEELNELFAELCGVPIKEIKELGLKDYTTLIVAFFKKPELKDFFTSLASLMQ